MQRTEKENKKQIQETMRGHISLAGPPSSFLSSPPSPYTYTWTLKKKKKNRTHMRGKHVSHAEKIFPVQGYLNKEI